jgi:hypothetical protein
MIELLFLRDSKDLIGALSGDVRSQHLGKHLLGRLNSGLQQSTKDEDFDVRTFCLWPDGKGPSGEWSEKSEAPRCIR